MWDLAKLDLALDAFDNQLESLKYGTPININDSAIKDQLEKTAS